MMLENPEEMVYLSRQIDLAVPSANVILPDDSHLIFDSIHAETMSQIISSSPPPKTTPSPKKRCSTKEARSVNVSLTYREYSKRRISLKSYKIVELKAVAKFNRLRITGNKPTLIQRIETCFCENQSAVRIQSYLRRFFVRRSFHLRGPGCSNRAICVNESDFFTLEPLNEIPFQEFFSYTDESNFTYGFNLCSLMALLKRKGRAITNPYNRATIHEDIIGNVIRLYIYSLILYPDHLNEEDVHPITRNPYVHPVSLNLLLRGYYYGFQSSRYEVRHRLPPPRASLSLDVPDDEDTSLVSVAAAPRNTHHVGFFDNLTEGLHTRNHPTNAAIAIRNLVNEVFVNEHQRPPPPHRILPPSIASPILHARTLSDIEHIGQISSRMVEIQSKTLPTRVQELFMEIDQLGNYTETTWFTQLTKRDCFYFYGHLYDTWRYRGRLSSSVKIRICPLGDPFMNVMPVRMRIDDVSEEQLRRGCITVMESMIYTARDIDDRKLGALHVLLALTVVSLPARNNMPWLYESMY